MSRHVKVQEGIERKVEGRDEHRVKGIDAGFLILDSGCSIAACILSSITQPVSRIVLMVTESFSQRGTSSTDYLQLTKGL